MKSPEQSEQPQQTLTLRRSLTRVDGVCLMISSIVAAAIFIFPGNVLWYMHGGVGPALILWLTGALLAMAACVVYGELGTAFPRAGGDYEYIKLAYGDRLAFASVFIGQIVQSPGGTAMVAIEFARYAYMASYTIFTNEDVVCDEQCDSYWSVRILALVSVWIATTINCFTVKMAARVVHVFVALKVVLISMILIFGVVAASRSSSVLRENFSQPQVWSASSSTTASDVGQAIVSIMWTYSGYTGVTHTAEELQDPARDLSSIIIFGISIVCGIYFSCNFAYLAALPATQIMNTAVVAGDLAMQVGGRWAAGVVSLLIAISALGSLCAGFMNGARLVYAVARDGQFPRPLMRLSARFQTPYVAVIAHSVLSTVLLLISSNLGTLLSYLSFASWTWMTVVMTASLWLRRKQPHASAARPFRTPLFPFPNIIVMLAGIFMVFSLAIKKGLPSLAAFAFIVSAFPVHYFLVRPYKRRLLARGIILAEEDMADAGAASSDSPKVGTEEIALTTTKATPE